MIETAIARSGQSSAVAVLTRGKRALNHLGLATRCDRCRTPKPTTAAGWCAAPRAHTIHALCPACGGTGHSRDKHGLVFQRRTAGARSVAARHRIDVG